MQITIRDCDLDQIYASGQCFRWQPMGGGCYGIPAFGRYVTVSQNGDRFEFSCGEDEFHGVWYKYFDLGTDYGKIKARAAKRDKYLQAAIAHGSGLRILRQDVWETIITFILSQNSNIPRIRKNIADLCALFDGAFPTQEQLKTLDESVLRQLGVGYRAPYLTAAAEYFTPETCSSLEKVSYARAHSILCRCKGVGVKVADCVCLFALHHTGAFPIDTHVKSILEKHYPDGFPLHKYRSCAGILQQYMFFYDIMKTTP